jgi:hypothetical protein
VCVMVTARGKHSGEQHTTEGYGKLRLRCWTTPHTLTGSILPWFPRKVASLRLQCTEVPRSAVISVQKPLHAAGVPSAMLACATKVMTSLLCHVWVVTFCQWQKASTKSSARAPPTTYCLIIWHLRCWCPQAPHQQWMATLTLW